MNEKYHFVHKDYRDDKFEIVGKDLDHCERIFRKHCAINNLIFFNYNSVSVNSYSSQDVGIYSIYKYDTLIATCEGIWTNDDAYRIIRNIDDLYNKI